MRPTRLICQAVSAPKSAPKKPQNPVGIHSQVWVGGWKPEQAETSIGGTKNAGYDLIERELRVSRMCSRFPPPAAFLRVPAMQSTYLNLMALMLRPPSLF